VEPHRHFDLAPLADGVWAAIARADGWGVGNAGIVDLGDATLVFDTGITPQAGRELAAAARRLTGRDARYVALSHYHNDHVRGAQAFPAASLLATEATRALLDTEGRAELASDREHADAQLAFARSLLDDPVPARRAFARAFVPYWEGLRATVAHVELRLPDVAFERRLLLHGARRRAELRSLGPAHTGDDAVLVLPDDGVVFCGDLTFVAFHPYLPDGDPERWRDALDVLLALGAERYVPGHGPVGGPDSIGTLAAHLDGLYATAARLRERGATAAEVEDLLPEDASLAWALAFPFYRANLRFLLARREGRA
jgi:glyoxylase-like metal-dependent hydrolase (beta-lactamase superfamily II)